MGPRTGRRSAAGNCPLHDGVNAHFDVVTILLLTKRAGKGRRVYEFEVLLPAEVVGTGFESIVMPHQIRTIPKLRLLERIGILTVENRQLEIENRVLEHIGVAFEAEEL